MKKVTFSNKLLHTKPATAHSSISKSKTLISFHSLQQVKRKAIELKVGRKPASFTFFLSLSSRIQNTSSCLSHLDNLAELADAAVALCFIFLSVNERKKVKKISLKAKKKKIKVKWKVKALIFYCFGIGNFFQHTKQKKRSWLTDFTLTFLRA